MPKLNDVYASAGDYLKASDLGGKSARLKISSYEIKGFNTDKGEVKKVVLSFEGKDRQLVVNKTNAITIAQNVGSEDLNDWVGHEIVIGVKKVPYQGNMVDSIRVREEMNESEEDIPF